MRMDSRKHIPGNARSARLAVEAGRFDIGCAYGRRVEADRSWSVYHVFTGVPAAVAGKQMVGLDRTAATEFMLAMNVEHCRGHTHRRRLEPPRIDPGEIGALEWR
jgi:hypothetical protein